MPLTREEVHALVPGDRCEVTGEHRLHGAVGTVVMTTAASIDPAGIVVLWLEDWGEPPNSPEGWYFFAQALDRVAPSGHVAQLLDLFAGT